MVQLAWSGPGEGPAWADCRVGSGAPDHHSTCYDDNDDYNDDDDGSPSSVTMSGLGGHTLALEEEQVARELLPSDAVVR